MVQHERIALILDDAPADRELYKRYLSRDAVYSYTILEAALGQQGLELWQQHQLDIVLLDYRLPDLDGLEFLNRLQPDILKQPLPVIMLTAEGNEAIAVQALKAGAQDYLVKGQLTQTGLQRAVNGAIETVRLRTQLQQRLERERVVAQITQQMYQTQQLDAILETAVTEVRQFLHTDRVLVFQLQPDGNGTVVAESVGAEWRSLLDSVLYDPCLAANYLRFSQSGSITHDPEFVEDYVKRYRQGQVTAIPDIHASGIDPCHVTLLDSFQVRANLVVPILHDSQFWGLLIAHHCAAPRAWQPLEIDLLKELATQLALALRQAELQQQAQAELTERRQIERELRESEERLRSALNASRMGTWDWNIQTGLIQWSDNLEAMFGLESGAFDGSFEMFVRFLHPDDRNRVLAAVEHAVATGEDYSIEFRVVYPDGTIRWALSQGKVFYDQKGQPTRMAGNDLDITERKQAEIALRESEQRYATLAQVSPVGIFRTDVHGDCLYTNARWCELAGLSPEVAQGKGWIRALHPDDRDRIFAEWYRATEANLPFLSEYRFQAADGKVSWVLGQVSAEKDSEGTVIGYVGTVTDISDRKQAENALQESESRFRQLAENTDVVFWIKEQLQNQVSYVSPAYERLWGLDPQELYDIPLAWVDHIHPDDREGAFAAFQSKAALSQFDEEYRIVLADGRIRWVRDRCFPLRDAAGNVYRFAGIAEDITDRKRAEQEREILLTQEQQARAEADRANRTKDEFLAILSHELRSPLNPILGWTQLLQTRTFDPANTAKALATIERNAKLQTQLIDDLLDMAKILRGKFTMQSTPVNLVYVIESALETMRTAAVAKAISLHPVLPNIGQVYGDAMRLQQVVWNLLSNALKFTPHNGRVDIRLEQVNSQAQITISDTGKGIAPAFLPYIFESFRQEDVSITRQYGGLGLGLAIVRSLVEAHGGTIKASSPGEGLGATFTVQLPLLEVATESEQTEIIAEQPLDLTGIRVLTVDDDLDTRELLNIILTQYGAEVLTVDSATAVLTNLETFRPDVLVSDISMPEIDGYMLIQQIRTFLPENGGQVPAIALTAYAREVDNQRAIASGYQRHITKPLEPERLVREVMALVRDRRDTFTST